MAELKKAVNKMEEQGIPRAVLSEGILTIDVDSHVETMEEQEDARWHQLLNAHRTKKILTGQLGALEAKSDNVPPLFRRYVFVGKEVKL